jgi:hypothetical protein
MAIQSSGAISLSDIQTEFGGSNPISISEYYRGGTYVTPNNTSVPTSGTISLSNFYGATKQFSFTVSSNQQEMNLSTYATSVGWDGSSPIVMTIASGVYIWSDSTSTGALIIPSSLNGLVTITNNGYIMGKGGAGGLGGSSRTSGYNGGPAIANSATGVTLTNASGAFIGGGGGGGAGGTYGGGGGGAGGGSGGNGYYLGTRLGGAGGSVGNSGANGATGKDTTSVSQGGGAGGGGADQTSWFGGGGGGGAGGGRIFPGSGGAGGVCSSGGSNMVGGAGGSAGNAGTNVFFTVDYSTTGGGGGWGAAGGGVASGNQLAGGSGGAAISGTAIATYTNNGTVYGSTA